MILIAALFVVVAVLVAGLWFENAEHEDIVAENDAMRLRVEYREEWWNDPPPPPTKDVPRRGK